jgi:trans-aconitate 2-methyltransferase
MQYQFGDSDLAAHRLEYLHEVYAGSSRAFLLDTVRQKPQLVVDMGCGPGYTTHFLADLLHCDRAVGLDSSENFISLAKKTGTPKVSFQIHDITTVPFPVEPADILYCRFLLSHLKDSGSVVSGWAIQLKPKGLLLIEEVECIHTRNETFALYLNIVDAMLEHQSGMLYIGRLLDTMDIPLSLKRRQSRIARLPVENYRAAAMFFMNIQTWKHRPFIKENYSSSMIDDLERKLETLAGMSYGGTEIEWEMRQTVFERQ